MSDRRILIVDDNADDERAKLREWSDSAAVVVATHSKSVIGPLGGARRFLQRRMDF